MPAETASRDTESFYRLLGDDYDRMTGEAQRWHSAREDYLPVVESLGFPKTLDAGCGTGGEAILLASLGCRVTGVDATGKFIEIARKKASAVGLPVEFLQRDLRDLRLAGNEKFGLIICRGNTLPHLRGVDDLREALDQLTRVAQKGALLIVGWLNYLPILREKRRLVGVTGDSDALFARFYDFIGDAEVAFNILIQRRIGEGRWKGEIDSTLLTPWSADDVGMLLRRLGWGEIEIAADLKRGEFDPDSSRDVVIFAIKE